MRSHLKIIRIPDHSPEWHAYRKNGIGGSDIGALLGLVKWKSSIEVFHNKVGMYETINEENEAMFHGTELEDYVAKLWQYWDQEGNYIDNYRKGNIIRKSKRVNGYVTNPKYPWLFASVDRLMNVGSPQVIDWNAQMDEEKVLECKTIAGYLVQLWESGIPPYHLAQVQTYMTILEMDYAEIAVLVDGRKFDVYGISLNKEFADTLIEKSRDIWYNRIVPAKELYAKAEELMIKGENQAAQEHLVQIDQYEPDPDNSEAYKEFMNERYKELETPKVGTEEDTAICKEIQWNSLIVKQLKGRDDLLKNKIRHSMKEFVEMTVEGGKVTWRRNKNGSRVMRVNMTDTEELVNAAEKLVKEHFDPIDPVVEEANELDDQTKNDLPF